MGIALIVLILSRSSGCYRAEYIAKADQFQGSHGVLGFREGNREPGGTEQGDEAEPGAGVLSTPADSFASGRSLPS